MKYNEISGNHYEALDRHGNVVGKIKAELVPSENGETVEGHPLGEWKFFLYRIKNKEEIKIPAPPIDTLNKAKAALEYHLSFNI